MMWRPNRSPPASAIASPVWMPIRTRIWLPSASSARAASWRCTSIMHRSAVRALGKESMNPSPWDLISFPWCLRTRSRTIWLCTPSTLNQAVSPSLTASSVEDSMSENTIVTVPPSAWSREASKVSRCATDATASMDVSRPPAPPPGRARTTSASPEPAMRVSRAPVVAAGLAARTCSWTRRSSVPPSRATSVAFIGARPCRRSPFNVVPLVLPRSSSTSVSPSSRTTACRRETSGSTSRRPSQSRPNSTSCSTASTSGLRPGWRTSSRAKPIVALGYASLDGTPSERRVSNRCQGVGRAVNTQIAEALPSYEVGDELGRGAMGVVLAATHRQLERAVAIKQLPPTFAVDPDVRRRFGSEAKTLAALSHPHIVPVYDYVEREGLCVLVMESLPGGTLWHLFTTDGLTMPSACAAILATCAGLDSAHAHGVLHRDIKPENLMFAADRTLKVTDFGIAQVFGGEETVTTVRGTVIGTPAYMAPEQAEGLNLGPAADVYAAGTVLYELLSGTLPFSADGDPLAVLESRVNEEPIPLSEAAPGVPEPLTEVTMRAIRRDPAERYPRAEDFGVAVGRAATAAFGEGWLGRADVTLRATGSIAAAAGPATPTATATTGGDGETTTAIAGRAGTGTVVTGSAPGSEPVVKVRATAAHHAAGEALADLQPEDLVRVDDLISPPKRPVISLAAAAVLAIAALICAIFAVGSRGHSDTVRAGVITVAGTDIGSSGPAHAGLGAPIPGPIQKPPSGARRARFAQIGFSAVGIGLGSSRSAPLEPSRNGAFTASVDAARVRILSSGELTGEFRLL